jgi:hypothetical protein
VYKFVNTKRKILYYNANIAFNKECLSRKITPKYAKTNIKPIDNVAKITIQKAEKIRTKQDIRLLYKNKQNLNDQLLQLHPHLANFWESTWHNIQESINLKLGNELSKKYTQQNRKLTLQDNKRQDTDTQNNIHFQFNH